MYTNYVPRGTIANTAFIVGDLQRFYKTFKVKQTKTATGEWFQHWDNATAHTAKTVCDFLIKNNIQLLNYPTNFPDIEPAYFFLFLKLKKGAGMHHHDPGGVQEQVGGGAEDPAQR